jgi:NADP-dependent 3-hydroxy acid dehydrogenase YdfG
MGTYLVTGATRGIGRCVIERLAGTHELIAVGRSADALAELPVERRIVADLARPGSLEESLGLPERLDGVVHCAGIARRADLADSSVADWDAHFRLNVTAVAELTRLLLPALRAAGGTVVLVNSGQGRRPSANSTVYAASKVALRSLADTLREEEPAIRVSSVFPGRVGTDMQRELRRQEGLPYEPERYIRPETVAAAVAYLLMCPPDAVVTDLVMQPARP